jgi:filamentous hemagglutinin family protein
VTIQQTAPKAIANWSSFNVGSNTEVYFNQSAGNAPGSPNGWIVLNRVTDPSGVPSQIMGQIKAEGSVYIINGNGIIFGGGSQINVSSLIASSLNLFSNTFGDANTPGSTVYRFLEGGIGDLNGSNFATDATLLTTTNPNAGTVTLQPGATINLTTNGLAVIAAPNVTNSGMITAPSGQVALIAGIGVSYNYNSTVQAVNGSNTSASTLLAFSNSGQITNAQNQDITPVGTLVNNGLIFTPRGNITLLGGSVAQNGVAVASTSVQQTGSIVITSQYDSTPNTNQITPGVYTGQVTFGPQAVTSVLPDTNGVTLASDPTSLAPFTGPFNQTLMPTQGPGVITISGQAIDFQGGTLVYAPGQVIAASTLVLPDPRPIAPPAPGRILLEDGAVLDVSGIPDTVLPAAYNLLTVKLGGNELADSPLQQNDFLFGQSVTVDMRLVGTNAEIGESRVGTPLANLTGYLNFEQQSIGQLLVNGGSITLNANEFVGAPGSIVNLMGGYVEYRGGMVNTTELIGSDGRIYNIGSANPNLTYTGIAGQFTVDHARWQLTDVFYNRLIGGSGYQPDYIQGGNAGTLGINLSNTANGTRGNTVANSGALILQSEILASAVAGARQVISGTLPSDGTFNFSGVLPIEVGDPGVLSAQSAAASAVPANFGMAAPLLATPGSVYASANVFSSQTLDDADFKNISLSSATTLSASAQPAPLKS